MDDFRVKKIVLQREDELAVFVSMMRAEKTGRYMTLMYPKNLKLTIDPVRLQLFVNNYRDTFRRKYKSPMEKRDTFRVTYEQMIDEDFEKEILPLLWDFLGVDNNVPMRKLRETIKQADPQEDLSQVIENYDELEFCFRHTDVLHFVRNKELKTTKSCEDEVNALDESECKGSRTEKDADVIQNEHVVLEKSRHLASWSILLPICSRVKASVAKQTSVDSKELKRNSTQTGSSIWRLQASTVPIM